MAREERRQREGGAAAARGGVVSGRTRTARGEGDGRDYSEVRGRRTGRRRWRRGCEGARDGAAVRRSHGLIRPRLGMSAY